MKKITLAVFVLVCPLVQADSDVKYTESLETALNQDTVVGFDNTTQAWEGPTGLGGSSRIELTGGNPAENLYTEFNDFGITFKNHRNPDFVFDYTERSEILISIDVKVDSIISFIDEVSRPWVLELRDYNDSSSNYPWTSVWYKFGEISLAQTGDWTRFTVHIADTSVTDLPGGWQGYGDEDRFANPILPPDRTFTDVLANMDEIAFHTLEPGFAFGFTDFKVRVDNISIGSEKIFSSSFESEISIYDVEAER